jgi:hypothetical protein
MDLSKVPQIVWEQLAKCAVQHADQGADVVRRQVDDFFYKTIYRRWARDYQKIDYTSNLEGETDVGWFEVAEMWKQGHQGVLGKPDATRGRTQMQTNENDPTHKGTRLGEAYSDGDSPARFQFLVNAGGGLVLLNRMRRACQTYIADKEFTVVQWWKVFGESFAEQGQSDACVVYLLYPLDDPDVLEFVENYLWPNIKDLVDDKFTPVGLVRVADKPIWATWIPDENTWETVYGKETLYTHYGSAGGLMGLVFGKAFARAVEEKPNSDADEPIPAAKRYAEDVIEQLS